MLGDFRPRALLILDEAHHAAPSGGSRYAISSQLTKAVRDIGDRFEHRLFLTATPHNGHSNSFSALLEMPDPQRFLRGDPKPVPPKDLEPVMIRRLKSDLRRLGESFPERVVERVVIDGLPPDAPELDLARRLGAYDEQRERRLAALPGQKAALAGLAYVGLQQRLLSSVAAFARTLKVHRRTLERLAQGAPTSPASSDVARAFVATPSGDETLELGLEGNSAEEAAQRDEDVAAEAATGIGTAGAVNAAPDLLECRLDAAAWRAGLLAGKPAVPSAPEAQDVGPADTTMAPGCQDAMSPGAASDEQIPCLPAAPPASTDSAVLVAENAALRMRVAELERQLAGRARSGRAPKEPGSTVPREGTKQAQVIAMLRRPEGAVLAQIVEATGWQPHTARAVVSSAIGKKLGLPVTSAKDEQGRRVYRIKG